MCHMAWRGYGTTSSGGMKCMEIDIPNQMSALKDACYPKEWRDDSTG